MLSPPPKDRGVTWSMVNRMNCQRSSAWQYSQRLLARNLTNCRVASDTATVITLVERGGPSG